MFFTGQITAAGKATSKVLVIGAGVASLAALGAIIWRLACLRDSRPEVKEQVQSHGRVFLRSDFKEGGSDSYRK